MSEKNKLDDIFRKKLKDPVSDAEYSEDDWNNLERLLDKGKKKKGFVYWLPVLGGVAAMLLLLVGWWLFRPFKPEQRSVNHPLVNITGNKNSGISTGQGRRQSVPKPDIRQLGDDAERLKNKNSSAAFLASLSPSATGVSHNSSHVGNVSSDMAFISAKGDSLHAVQAGIERVTDENQEEVSMHHKIYHQIVAGGNDISVVAKKGIQPQYTLSFVAAPDVNGVGGLQNGRMGTNAGIIFSVRFADRINISSGLMYSSKPYLTSFAAYHSTYQFKESPSSVLADCRMLDIPINLGYDVYHRHRNTFSVGTGISSYIMLHQNYTFQYSGQYQTGPSSYNVPGVSKYYFGILNLNVAYTRQMNSAVSFTVQPYLKLPLANVGYSQVRLKTAGVAVAINWNLTSSSKP